MVILVAWLIGSAVPLLASILLVVIYRRRWKDIETSPTVPVNEPIRIPARGNLRREITRIAGNSCFVFAGLWAVGKQLLPEYMPDDNGVLTITMLLAGQWLIGSNSVTDWIDQQRLDRAVDRWNQEYIPVEKDRADELEACMQELRAQNTQKGV